MLVQRLSFCVLCLITIKVTSGFIVTSSNTVLNFSRLDLTPNLQKFIDHEKIRLKVITDFEKHEDEVPLVKQRLKEFESLMEELKKNKTSEVKIMSSVAAHHPISLFVALSRFVNAWTKKFENTTLYGKHFKEFIETKDNYPLPDDRDLYRTAMCISVIQEVYNLSTDELIKGRVNGHQGAPLSAKDCYYIGDAMLKDGLLERAYEWIKHAVDNLDLKSVDKGNSDKTARNALVALAQLSFQKKKDKDGALKLLEKALEIDPDNEELHQEYMKHRAGRSVTPLNHLDVRKVEPWKRKFFDMCGNSTNITGYHIKNTTNPRLRCRYKTSNVARYMVYREEIISVSPYISIVYNLVSDREIKAVKNASFENLNEYLLPGNDKQTLWQYRGNYFRDVQAPVFANISWKCGDVSGFKVTQQRAGKVSRGEPIHVIDYGIGGLALPHLENYKSYRQNYMGFNGKRFATMLIQLSDVDVGGATVFIEQNITVAPKKGNAILVFNYNPAWNPEMTSIATCPLATGHNIVLEKGIWQKWDDPSRVGGRKLTSTHIARERVQEGTRALLRSQKMMKINKIEDKDDDKKVKVETLTKKDKTKDDKKEEKKSKPKDDLKSKKGTK